MNSITKTMLVLALATIAMAQTSFKVSGLPGELSPIRMLTNSKGDVIVLAMRQTPSGALLTKLAGEQQFRILYDDSSKEDKLVAKLQLANEVVVNTVLIGIGLNKAYYYTLDTRGRENKTWEIALTGGTPKLLMEKDKDVTLRLSQLGFSPISRKIVGVTSAFEDANENTVVFVNTAGYLGYFTPQTDGSFKELFLLGTLYDFPMFGRGVSPERAEFATTGSERLPQLSTYDYKTKVLKPSLVISGASIGGETVQRWFGNLSSWKRSSFSFHTANGGRIAEVVNGSVNVLYRTPETIKDFAVNSVHVFAQQGNRLLMIDSAGATTTIASVGDTIAGKRIAEFFAPAALVAYGCSASFLAKTDTSTSGSPHLFTVSLPCTTTQTPMVTSAMTATFENRPIAPGGLFTIKGSNLSPLRSTPFNYFVPGVTTAVRTPLPTLLGGSRVLVNGREAPLLFATCFEGGNDCQINAQMPVGVVGPTARVVVQRYNDVNGRVLEATSQEFLVPVQSVSPTVFKLPDGLAIMQVADEFYRLVNNLEPAHGGQTIVLYGTGFGLTSPLVPEGTVAGEVLSRVSAPAQAWVKYTVGGSQEYWEAEVQAFASPQFAGVAQLATKLPSVNPDPGTKVYLVLKVGEEVLEIELPYN